ncbi:MAG: helix-turn-helix transcriptional regulator [Lachnospiraceae bacterium]|nr:helix-turn-helix transcriptional regulator [Lachnospiraceae bacterium]MDY4970220.1 helix-turn-helix transcriptional regulator [Lachnospiraceae bacterium]
MDKFDNEKLGARVKELRLQMGLTQNQVAKALHVTPGYISNVENNRTAMSLRMLTYYARLSGITLDSLVGQIEPEYEKTALDNELLEKISLLSAQQKRKLIKTLEIWESETI